MRKPSLKQHAQSAAGNLALNLASSAALSAALWGSVTSAAQAQSHTVGAAATQATTQAATQATTPASNPWREGYWRAAVSPYAPHLRPSDEHSDVWALALERQRHDHWLAGGSFFSNSFGQPSAYLYVGRRFPALLGQAQLFGQISGGLLYGYRGQYQDKVPLNHNGFSPGGLVSIGWQFNRQASLTVHAVGDAAVMFQFGWDFR